MTDLAKLLSDPSELDAGLAEAVLSEEAVYEGALIKVRRQQVRLPGGRVSHRELMRHCGAAAMVAVDGEGRVLLERQWRAPLGRAFWEIPAGKMDPGETPFETAVRELEEEAGVLAGRWTFLGTIHNAIGYSDEHIEIYLARELTETAQSFDDNEFIALVRVPLAEAVAMTRDGRITDVKSLAGLAWAEAYFEGRLPQARDC
ncbi:MAG: NUDIX hydrolase [Duodenibacillus sp.]|nr:NUDIX hydrolase [Duodenibacillus sp.]